PVGGTTGMAHVALANEVAHAPSMGHLSCANAATYSHPVGGTTGMAHAALANGVAHTALTTIAANVTQTTHLARWAIARKPSVRWTT
ncbi:MAG: hypothetical protein ACE5OS_03680, partial [Anaerolineae bacterium]